MEFESVLSSSDWISAGGIALVLLGIALLIVEVFLPAFGLFGFAGVSIILIGVVQLHQTGYIEEMPVSVEVIIMLAILSIALAIAGGIYTYRLYRKKMTTGIEGMIGESAKILNWSGKEGRIFVQGENWQAYSDEAHKLDKDDEVYVAKVSDMKVKIIPHLGDDKEAIIYIDPKKIKIPSKKEK
ncbi:MAG: NfeD family protein [Pseudomonadota bacterium]